MQQLQDLRPKTPVEALIIERIIELQTKIEKHEKGHFIYSCPIEGRKVLNFNKNLLAFLRR